jgi:ethylbenzene dioxygenase ferredoxin subunit
MSRVLLCQRDELAPGELKKEAHSEGDAICVYNLGGTFYATTDMSPTPPRRWPRATWKTT